MTGENNKLLMTSLVLLAFLVFLCEEFVMGSPMGQKSWENYFRKDGALTVSDNINEQTENDGCLPNCEVEGALHPDRTSCNHFFVCSNNFEISDLSNPRDEFKVLPSELHGSVNEYNSNLDAISSHVFSLLRCACWGKNDVYNRYLQRCSRRGHCRVSCTAQGDIFGNWTSVTYNGYECSIAFLPQEISPIISDTLHLSSKTYRTGDLANSEGIALPQLKYQETTIQPELSKTSAHVTPVSTSTSILHIEAIFPASTQTAALASTTTIPLLPVSPSITQLPNTIPGLVQTTVSSFRNNYVTAVLPSISLSESTHSHVPLPITLTSTNTIQGDTVTALIKPETEKTPVIAPTQTFIPDHMSAIINSDASAFITLKPASIPIMSSLQETVSLPATLLQSTTSQIPVVLPATIQIATNLPSTIQIPAILPATIPKPTVLPATIPKPIVLPATIPKPTVLPGTIPKPTVLPATIETPILPTTTQNPAFLPETLITHTLLQETVQKPDVLPEIISENFTIPNTTQAPSLLPATILMPSVLSTTIHEPTLLPEIISKPTTLPGIAVKPEILPDTIQMSTEASSKVPVATILPADNLKPAVLPSSILVSGISQTSIVTSEGNPATVLPDNQNPSIIATGLTSSILPDAIQKPVILPAIIHISTNIPESDLQVTIMQTPVLLPDVITNTETNHIQIALTTTNEVTTLPASFQSSVTFPDKTQKPALFPETTETSSFSSRPTPTPVTLPITVQTSDILPTISQIGEPVSVSISEPSSIISTTTSETTLLPMIELKPANCRPMKCIVANTRFPNPKDCTRYYKCVMHQGHLVARPYICPSVMPTFSPSLMMCLRGIKCQPTCSDTDVSTPSVSFMTSPTDNTQG